MKTSGDPLGFVGAIRGAVRSFDPNQPINDIQTFEQRLATSIAKERFSAVLFGVFSVLAITLAAVGLYGVLSYLVTQRIQEVGVRMALGARPADVVKMVVGRGMTVAFIGVILGLAGAFAQTHLIEGLLFGVTASDPRTFVVVTITITLIAFVASLIPARRAARTDPIIALRHH